MRLLFGHDEAVGAFVGQGLGTVILPPFVSIGVITEDGRLVGGIVFNGYTGANIEVTVYGPHLMRRGLIRALLSYAFNQQQVIRLTARTKRSNRAMCKILPRLGFIYEASLKQYFGPDKGDDAILYRMTRHEATRWLGEQPR